MGLQNGSFSLTRYRVLGRENRLTVKGLNTKMGGFQAGPLKLQNATHELAYGWVLPDNPELEEKRIPGQAWDLSDCLYEDGILLRIRVERRSVSASLLQDVAQQRWREHRQQEESGPEPQRVLKKQIMDETKDELLRLSLPTLNYIDAFWKDQDDFIYLFSQGKMARECFEDLFRKSFGQEHNLTLMRILPPMMGLQSGEWSNLSAQKTLLEKIRHTLPGASSLAEIS